MTPLGALRSGAMPEADDAALVAGDPRRVHDALAPVFAGDDHARQNAIVRALGDQLDAAFYDEENGADDDMQPRGPVPDARWIATLSEWEPRGDAVTFADLTAADVLRLGLAWVHGERRTDGPRRVSSGAEHGDPFVVAGFDVADARFEDAVAELGPRARTLHLFKHQCGGHACNQAHVGGIPLVGRAFRAAFADGTRSARLREVWGAQANATPERLAASRAILEEAVPLPILDGGREGIVWTEPCRPLAWLSGLDVVRVLSPGRPWLREAEWEQIRLRREGPFTAAHEALLVTIGERLGLGRPRLFVLWENSD